MIRGHETIVGSSYDAGVLHSGSCTYTCDISVQESFYILLYHRLKIAEACGRPNINRGDRGQTGNWAARSILIEGADGEMQICFRVGGKSGDSNA